MVGLRVIHLNHDYLTQNNFLKSSLGGVGYQAFPPPHDKVELSRKPNVDDDADIDDVDDDDDDILNDDISAASLTANETSLRRNDALDDFDVKAEAGGQDSGWSIIFSLKLVNI